MKTFLPLPRYNKCKAKCKSEFQKGGDFISNEEYFEYLIDTYGNLVYSICYKTCGNPFDAEDLTQEVFLSVYRHLDNFDGSYEKAWLCKITSRKCLDFLKQAGRRIFPTEDTFFEGTCDNRSSPEEHMLEQDTRKQLLDACNHLKPPYDQIAKMHFYDELTAAEIANQKKVNLKTIQTQIYRAKAMLKKSLKRDHTIISERRAT